jgi:tRNA threonylcarbamoyladenosine modification (KEOPS) complex Cgi121 subunit
MTDIRERLDKIEEFFHENTWVYMLQCKIWYTLKHIMYSIFKNCKHFENRWNFSDDIVMEEWKSSIYTLYIQVKKYTVD